MKLENGKAEAMTVGAIVCMLSSNGQLRAQPKLARSRSHFAPSVRVIGEGTLLGITGMRTASELPMHLHAERVALGLMTGGTRLDWSAWYVEVHDERGRPVLAKAFTDVRADHRLLGIEGRRPWR